MRGIFAILAALLLVSPFPTAAQERVHGESSLFVGPTVKLAWAVRKGASDESSDVIIRVVNAGGYAGIRVGGVDPFTKDRTTLVMGRALGATTDLVIQRSRFADHPSAEIHFFASDVEMASNRPALTVFYLGVPDTTPEFVAARDAEPYFARVLAPAR
jgi:hypothetical protein